MARRTGSFVWAAFIIAAVTGTAAAAQDVASGQVTARIVSPTDTTQQYALYLPSGYGRAPGPVLFVLDPRGRAVDALEPFRAVAERHGWIVMSSWNARSDGSAEPNVRAMNAMLGDARASFDIAPGRLYIAGFSGTARIAWDFARQLDGAVAGIFGASAGTDPRLTRLETPPARPAFFGTAGTFDFNHDEMRRFARRLEVWGLPHRMRVFEGGHTWPPDTLAAEAVDWFELQAMRAGLAPVDAEHVARLHARDSVAAAQQDIAAQPIERLERLAGLARDYAGLRDTAAAAGAARTLRADPHVADAVALERALLDQAAEREARLVEVLADLSGTDPPPGPMAMLDTLEVEALQAMAAGADLPRAHSARRTLEQIFVATSFYAPRELIENGRAEHALVLLEVADRIHPGRPQVLVQRARALAALDRLDEARAALDAALRAGFPEGGVRGDPLLARLRRSP